MKIGIPRALIYWKRPYFWESFFENLGFEVLLSPKTNKEIVEMGVKISDPETCFSNKVYFGHLKWLEGKCDLIFVPRLKTNKEKLEYCPKFFGLPDLSKILVKTKILTEDFNERKEPFETTLFRLGKKLGKNKKEIERAKEIAILKEKEERKKLEKEVLAKLNSNLKKIVLISHPYNLYDEYVNLRIKDRLEELGITPIFIEEVPVSKVTTSNLKLGEKSKKEKKSSDAACEFSVDFHWEFAKEIMEKIDFVLNYKIKGAIEISSFACGCDAVLKEFVEKKFKESKIPFLYLIIDEHTGEAGFQTRLEAFVDTL
jgi:predicted nucleotide-binding protein (sugar kinase/HSP70/actin superfamily)